MIGSSVGGFGLVGSPAGSSRWPRVLLGAGLVGLVAKVSVSFGPIAGSVHVLALVGDFFVGRWLRLCTAPARRYFH